MVYQRKSRLRLVIYLYVMEPKVQPQDNLYGLFAVVLIATFIIASLGTLIGFEKVFFPFAGWLIFNSKNWLSKHPY